MHSFTSNSNDRLPILRWRKIISAVFLLLIGFFIVWDVVWVHYGYHIQPKDDSELWSYQRRRVSLAGKNAIVFTGSSRIRAAIDLNEVRRITGKQPFQLAIPAGEPLPVLESLAQDESFNGTVIAEITEYIIHRETETSTTTSWIAEYNENKYGNDRLLPLKSRVQSLIIFPDIGLTLPEILRNIFTGKLFDRNFLQQVSNSAPPGNTFERSWQGYHDDLTPEQIEERRQVSLYAINQGIEWQQPDPAKFIEIARQINSYTKRIEARGGKVILVNLPLSGEVKDLNEKYFPKKYFWYALAATSSAQTVYYGDHPQLAAIETMDGTHFNGRNATLFTDELLKIIDPSAPR